MSGKDPADRRALLACAAIAAGAALVRLLPCWNDFWLDEIWSYETARQLSSPGQVFTLVHHSNNNHLNTLLIYAFGPDHHWAVYRLPAFFAGVASVLLAAALARRRGRLEAVLAALLGASCFSLIHFSSEARGYSLAVCFALGGALALQRDLERPRARTAIAFGTCVVLGFLAHLVSLFFWAGAACQSLARVVRERAGWRGAAQLARLHLAPAAAFAALYAVDLRFLEVGGGNPTDYRELLAQLFGFSLGLPVIRELGPLYALLGAALALAGLVKLARERDDAWILYAVTIFAAPATVIGALQPEVVALRYFLIGISFTLLLASFLLAAALRAGGARRLAALGLLGAYLVGNAVHTAAFLERGRGGFRAALRYMVEHTAGRDIRVGSDHDFRNGLVLRFYARELPEGRRLVYSPQNEWPQAGPEWVIVHRAQRPPQPPPSIGDAYGNHYALAAEFDHAAISGFYWALYRRSDAAPAP